MRVVLLAVGRPRGPVADAVAEYEERARRYWKLDVVEVPSGTRARSAEPGEVMEKEGERLLARVPEGLDLIALTRHGTLMDTDQLAGYLHDHQIDSRAGVALVVGGAYGLAPSVLARARLRVSLSKMTLPHEMARLLVAEQLYRAGTIVRGEPYHKG